MHSKSQENKKRRILVLADTPTCSTGFAQVSKNVLKELYDTGKYEIDIIGINYMGAYNRKAFDEKYYYINRMLPAKHPKSPDMYGREYTIQVLQGLNRDLQPPWDIFFTIQDSFVLESKSADSRVKFANTIKALQKNTLLSAKHRSNHFIWVGYFPIDGTPKKHWIDDAIAKTDYPVAYCEYGREEILRHASKENKLRKRLRIINHGTNTDDFYPLSQDDKNIARQKFFGKFVKPDTHLIINVNRNQRRKDLIRTLMVYKEFRKKVPSSFLYLHCNPRDVGGNIYDFAKNIGLDHKKFGVPTQFSEHKGVTLDVLNQIYNAADALLTTTLGEGWGLSITEAMATKTPVYAPNITSVPELLNTRDGFKPEISRGISFKAGNTVNQFISLGMEDNELIRPLTDVNDAVNKLVWGYENKDKVAKIVDRAYKWASELTWKTECRKWVELFDEACEVNDKLRKGDKAAVFETGLGNEKVFQDGGIDIGRNDPCPVCKNAGKKIKIKKCLEHRDYYLK